MRRRIIPIIIATAAGALCGCERFNQWVRSTQQEEKQVPVTEPTRLQKTGAGQTQQKPTGAGEVRPKNGVETRPDTSPAPVRADTDVETGPQDADGAREQQLGDVITEPVLQIDSQTILTVTEVLRPLERRLERIVGEPPGDKKSKVRVKELIERQIWNEIAETMVFAEASKKLDEERQKHIEAQLRKYRKEMLTQAGGSETKLKQRLAEQDTNMEEVIAARRRQLIIDMYFRSKFTPSVSIPRRRLVEYYNRHISQYRTPKKVRMQIIAAPVEQFLPARPSGGLYTEGEPTEEQLSQARAEARKIIDRAAEAIGNGQDFAKVAREFSGGLRAEEGGVWPMMPRGSLRWEKVEKVAFELDQGQVSHIIETDDGFYIVKALEVDPGRQIEFRQVQPRIEEKLRLEEYGRKVDTYLNELIADYKRCGLDKTAQWRRFIKYAVKKAVDLSNR